MTIAPVDDTSEELDPYWMPLMRQALGFTQGMMAKRLGLSLRAYQDLESGATAARRSHLMAMRLVSLEEAVDRGDRSLATIGGARLADRWAQLPRQP